MDWLTDWLGATPNCVQDLQLEHRLLLATTNCAQGLLLDVCPGITTGDFRGLCGVLGWAVYSASTWPTVLFLGPFNFAFHMNWNVLEISHFCCGSGTTARSTTETLMSGVVPGTHVTAICLYISIQSLNILGSPYRFLKTPHFLRAALWLIQCLTFILVDGREGLPV